MSKVIPTMNKNAIVTAVKYGISVALACVAFFVTGSKRMLIAGLFELVIIILVTNSIAGSRKVNWAVNSLLILALNVQYGLLICGGSFIKLIMLSNLNSVEALRGKAGSYLAMAIFIVVASILPVCRITIKGNATKLLLTVMIYGALLSFFNFSNYSPFISYIKLVEDGAEQYKINKMIKQADFGDSFFKSTMSNAIDKPNTFPDKPNVIVIFTEGLSKNIVDDERSIMPNAEALEKQSISFINYYNHTAATYRGILGQLTSGYQQGNLDRTGLTSLEKVFDDEGYYTSIINVEPENKDFTEYLGDLGFNELVTDEATDGISNTITDKRAYELLWDTISEYYNEDKHFFTFIYTLGTHVSFYSDDVQYKDGKNAYLSKFYNADYWLGDFLEKFKNSEISNNTIIIYTTDHASWADSDYLENFRDNMDGRNDFTDTIPLFIYYKGLSAETIDVGGRNSLDFAPTILDLLDIDHPNYFLGDSLFNKTSDNYFDTLTSYEGTRVTTKGSVVTALNEEEDKEFLTLLGMYYAEKRQEAIKQGLYDQEEQ